MSESEVEDSKAVAEDLVRHQIDSKGIPRTPAQGFPENLQGGP